MNLFVSPVVGCQIAEWTFSSLVWKWPTLWGNRDQYSVELLNAVEVEPFHFSLDIEVSPV